MSLGRFLSQDITEAVEYRSAGKVVDFLSDPIPSGKKKDTQQITDQAYEEDQEAPIKDPEPTPEETGTEEPKESPDNPDNNIMTTLTKPSETVSEFLETYKPNEMTNIEGILPEENYKDLPTLEQAIQNKIPENYEVVLNKFYPYILDINAHSGKYDISFDALYYLGLGGLGGKYVTWQLGRETLSEEEKHKRDFHNCHCDVNHGQTFQINDILNHSIEYANEHGFDPPAPMFGMAGHPNCLIDGTRILTKNGLKLFPELEHDDLICSMNPETGIMEYVPFNTKVSYEYSGDMYEFKSRGHHSVVTPNHRVVYRKKYGKTLYIDTAETLISTKQFFRLPRTAEYCVEESSQHDILVARFFGWYLSEGCVSKRNNGSYQVGIAQYKKDNYERIYNICHELGLNPKRGANQIYIFGEYAKYIYNLNLGKSHEKYIPEFIKNLGKNALEAFLEEFARGDGHTRLMRCFGYESQEVVYFTSSVRLRDGIIDLLLKIGKSSYFSICRPKGFMGVHKNGVYTTNYDVYTIRVSRSNNSLFYNSNSGYTDNKSSIRKIQYTGLVHCVELSKYGVFCFEYKGSIGWTGNCNCSLQFSKSANFTDETSIQDDCPGLPSNGTDEDKRSMKKAIFDSIPEMVYVNYRTFPPLYITEKTAKAHHMNTRYGSIEVVTEEAVNKPVEIVKNSIAVLPFGFWVPVNADWVGFATKMSQDFVEVFLPELMFKVKVRKKCVKYLDAFDETGSPADKDTTFVMVNGKLGILCYYLKDIPHVYFPDMDKIIKVDQVTPVTVQGLAS